MRHWITIVCLLRLFQLFRCFYNKITDDQNTKDDAVLIGDRLYTDIAIGKRHGVTAVLVLSGETQPSDVETADPADRPDFTFDSLDDVDLAMF